MKDRAVAAKQRPGRIMLHRLYGEMKAPQTALLAEEQPHVVLKGGSPRFIDEWQDGLRSSEKVHVADPAMAPAMLGVGSERLIRQREYFGFVCESMVVRDL